MPGGETNRGLSGQLPAVYGYLRAEDGDEPAMTALRQELGRFCEVAGLRLVTVCCDRGCDGSEIARPGFAAVLDALALPDSVALVVPDLDHLSPEDVVREALLRSIRRTGAKILMARKEDATVDSHPAVDDEGTAPE